MLIANVSYVKCMFCSIYNMLYDSFCNAVRGERFILAAKCVIWRFIT